MIDLLCLTQQDMENLLYKAGFPRYRGRQLYQWCHEKEVKNLQAMANLPHQLKQWLEDNTIIGRGKRVDTRYGRDKNTVKFLLEFPEHSSIETVLMCYEREASRNRNTVCVSTQAGCGMGCRFCATALGGFQRNLTVGEIIEQVNYGNRYLKSKKEARITNVVYMGMGEPLANWDAVWKSIQILNDAKKIGMRRITVSTAGLVPQIKKITALGPQFTLAVSLHAPNDTMRNRLMPINRRFPLKELFDALDEYTEKTGRRITIEYALFAGVNDSKKTALELVNLLKGRLVHVNLLPGNPVKETGLFRSGEENVQSFLQILETNGIETTLRESRGQDIDGACGQLRGKM
ncbi:MAG TPA: 23S rRNA (adenine(2503)-C(2))-methyltransferase RlmN [Firmicutes bacterium]|nr:23S rRNA (adenine(2503)-C(2))-methyltransferase RlmN [Bacillota bacterium]